MEYTFGVYLIDKNKQLLICKATGGGWSIPKGLKNDEKEPSWSAAKRELLEESGINLNNYDYPLPYLLPPSKYKKRNKILIAYLVILNEDLLDFNLKCNSFFEKNGVQIPEVDDYKWLSIEDSKKYIHESQISNLHIITEIIK